MATVEAERVKRDLIWIRTTILILGGVGLSGLLMLSYSARDGNFVVFGSGLLVAGAAFSVGGLMDFSSRFLGRPDQGPAPRNPRRADRSFSRTPTWSRSPTGSPRSWWGRA
jgi:hypothetical protein